MSTLPTVFLTSATGTQGLALAHHLRSLSYPVRATVRDPSAPASISLSQLGVTLLPGSWDDLPSLQAGLASCSVLFLNTSPSFHGDPTRERGHALNILRIAKEEGVKHAVYSSALAVNRINEVTVFDEGSILGVILRNKEAIEQAVKTMGFEKWTILRPASFMENFLAPKAAMYPGLREKGVWTIALLERQKIPLVEAGSIAGFVVEAVREPERFAGKEIEIAGDELAPEEIMEVLSEVAGRELEFRPLMEEEVEAQRRVNPMIIAQLALRELGKFVKAEESRSWGVEMSTFREFLESNAELVKKTYT